MGLLFVYLIGALAISSLCSVLEAVLFSTPASFINMKEAAGDKRAATFKKLKQDMDKPVAAILTLNTISHTVGAAGVGAQATKVFGDQYFGLVSIILTLLILVISEITPKMIGANYWRSLAMGSGKIMHYMVWITYPFVKLSQLLTRAIAPSQQEASVSREEISAMVDIGAEEGTFHIKESGLIQNVIKMESIRVREIMTPRIVVSVVSEDMTLREFYADTSLKHSRIPTYSQIQDNITGYVMRQTVLENLTEDRFEMKLAEIRREITLSVDTAHVATLWEDLLSSKEQISMIVDEYGSFEGIVTMEDIIETLLGFEILDEKDSIADMQEYAKQRWEKRQKQINR